MMFDRTNNRKKQVDMNNYDLMIGDLVEVVSSDHLKYVQIVEIYKTSVLVQDCKGEWEPEEFDLADIKPIDICLLCSDCERLDENNMPNTCDLLYPIKHVHELQHALRLCGIKKEINL